MADDDLMSQPQYIDESLALIAKALQNGFDVLQLENGDIITTGVKTIVTTYRWNGKARKMSKLSSKETSGANQGLPAPAMLRAAGAKVKPLAKPPAKLGKAKNAARRKG